MSGFESILVAFEGSDNSVEALKTAETLAKNNKARLTVVYVHERSSGNNVVTPGASPTPTDDLNLYQSQTYIGPGPVPKQIEHAEVVDSIPDKVIADAKVRVSKVIDVDYEVLSGNPANELCDYAEKNQFDLIVIGNRGLSRMKKLVLGSVSNKVTNQANCSVLVVK
ncbi:universal stress protein [Ornithinibacillus salinisoli]|uniref:Universal stress protein n=1 Tax=Ornithinibacillus salinisoli TaxID=1848459 RepID=A0ABW4VZZ0_9BACI